MSSSCATDHIDRFILEPENAGLTRVRLEVLKGGEAEHNAAELKRLLQGQHGTYRDIVLLERGRGADGRRRRPRICGRD